MQGSTVEEQDFSQWDGQPFFQGTPQEGRHAYIIKSEETGEFTASGAIDPLREIVFKIRGNLGQLERFLEEMAAEGARVSYGSPPFDTNTSGDKAGSSTTRPGIKDKK